MKYKLIIDKLRLLDKNIITKEELTKYLNILNINYNSAINYLTNNNYLITMFRGIFYILSIEERAKKTINKNIFELLTKSLELKKIDKWYFALDTSLKINNIKHEYDNIIYIINNKLYRNKILKINGYNIKIIKLKDNLFNFGINKNKYLKYSDIEKTVIDIIYLDKYNSINDKNILNKINDLLSLCNKDKLIKYSKKYNKTTNKFIKENI
ncbi:hypothetical protein M0P25_00870 [archaeon]|jgi:hypothetical protein|nr:hypothetical protein [archaeon]